jgi:xylulokinase
MKQYLIGVDLGTQGVKVALYTPEGHCEASVFLKSYLYQRGGMVKEDPDDQLANLIKGVQQVLAQSRIDANQVVGLAIAGQMAGVLGIDRQGHHVTYYDSWLDTRCVRYINHMLEQAGDEIALKTGSYPSYNHGPKMLWWKHEYPETYHKIHAFVQPAAYLAMRLCGLSGEEAFIDRTYIHFSGFADNKVNAWDADLCDLFRFDIQKLPRIVEPDDIIGHLSTTMAEKCGLSSGLPLVAGCGDTMASFLAAGATQPGICVDVAGTASVFSSTTDEMINDLTHKTIACGQSVIKGLWHPYAYLNGGGLNIEWWLHNVVEVFTKERNGKVAELDKLSSAIHPSAKDPIFLPYLGGRVCPAQPELRGAWFNLDWSHNANYMYRAILESVALEYRHYLGIISSLDERFTAKEVRVSGGGGKSDLWNQIKADTLQLPVLRSLMKQEGAAMGAAMLAGKGIGLFDDLHATATAWLKQMETFPPNTARKKLSAQRLQMYESLTALIQSEDTKKIFDYV